MKEAICNWFNKLSFGKQTVVFAITVLVGLLLSAGLLMAVMQAAAPTLPCKDGCPMIGYSGGSPIYACYGRSKPSFYKCEELP